ncbi:MAG: DNA-binding protein [Bacteroidetes bacterium MedPE-SWsnd-G1]|nr:MAG: DNA-binding protein [Bacteroidetes bacterium MedPE-SWsnd-G1]
MKDLKEFEISFIGLKLGKHQFSYQIDNTFFEFFQYDEFDTAELKVDLLFEKKNNMFNLEFNSKGKVIVACDVTGEPFELKVNGQLSLIVKFGDEYDDDNDEILIIPHNSYQLNGAQFMYEMVVLSLPIKKVHPGIEDGTLESEVLEKLKEFEKKKEEVKETIDPRWAKLKELKTNKNE